MNDEQSSTLGGQASAQKAGEIAEAMQTQLSELVASAKLANENAKASENDAKNVLNQLKQILAEAKEASDKLIESTPKFAAAATEVEIKRTAVGTHAQQIEDAQKRATEVRAELDSLLVNAKQTQAEAEAMKQSVEGTKNSTTQVDADILKTKAAVDASAEAVAAALAASNSASAKTKGLAEIAEAMEQRIKDYEGRLIELSGQCDGQLEAIKALLPGATGAGLASAFDQRRKTFLNPGKHWQWLFVGSVVILAVMALAGLVEAYLHTPAMTYEQLIVRWISRIPFAAALVWLAMHASRESALAKRLEEDYGFKASVASSFQGFQEQMKIVGGSAAGNEPLKTLCDATLAQITNPPGRIYEKHPLAVSPTTELLKAAQAFVDAAKVIKLPG